MVNVASGDFVYLQADDCVERHYGAGTAFIDPGGGNVHTAWNPSDETVTVIYATFFEIPETGPLTIVAPTPGDCAAAVGPHGGH